MIKHRALILTLVLLASVQARAQTATTRRTTTAPAGHDLGPEVLAFMKPMEVAAGDDPVRQKLTERHNTAVRLLELRVEGYRRGLSDVGMITEAAQLAARAKLELAQQVSERDRIIEQLLGVSKTIESRLEQQWKRGIVSEAEVLRARYARETVEVDLLKLRQAGAGPTTRPR